MTRGKSISSEQARETPQQTLDYRRVERALRYLAEHHATRPALAEVAAEVGLSEHHFQRLFQRWAGVSPKRFAQFLTREHALSLLARHSVLSTSQALGLGSSARLHDLLVSSAGVTPGDVRSQGKSLRIAWGVHDIVNENMASAARVHIATRGRDPRHYSLLATGGAGPVHAYHVARKANVRQVICPPAAGVGSALGLLMAPARIDRRASAH